MMDAEPQQKPFNGNVTHGDTLLKKAVSKLGSRALDGRSTLAKELGDERRELIQALGGPTEVSPQEMAIIDMIAQKRIRRKPIAQWALLNRDALFNRRSKSLAPITLQLEQLEESEVRLLKELGLKRRARQLPSLGEYLNGKTAAPVTAKTNDTTTTHDKQQESPEDQGSSVGNHSPHKEG
jgi:hypothetical protein